MQDEASYFEHDSFGGKMTLCWVTTDSLLCKDGIGCARGLANPICVD